MGKLLVLDINNAANHWAGWHSGCQRLDAKRVCVKEKWGAERAYYASGGATHQAVSAWLKAKITPAKMKHYTRARENFLSETFHSVINKYASKRIHYSKSHRARVAAAGLDWSENRDRQVLEQKVN